MNKDAIAYLTLLHARSLYHTAPAQLSAAQRQIVSSAVQKQLRLEQSILSSPVAIGVRVPGDRIKAAVAEVRGRYANAFEFNNDLISAGLSRRGLEDQLHRCLRVERVLEAVSKDITPISKTEAEIFYRLHLERFTRPERRQLRHILMTVNAESSTCNQDAVLHRMNAIHAECLRDPGLFESLALRHSECPTALQGGALGWVPRNKLFPTLEEAAFALQAGELSDVTESPMGFHVVLCEEIAAEHTLPFQDVQERILTLMNDARKRRSQIKWIASLRSASKKGNALALQA